MHDTDYRGCKITRHTDGKWEADCEDIMGVGVHGRASRDSEAQIHTFVDGLYQQAEKKLATLEDLAAKVKEDQSALDGILLSAKDIGQQAIAKARQIGKYIKEARGLISKGQWMKWLENEAGIKYQTARKYTKIAEVDPVILQDCTSLMDAYYFLGLDKPRTNRAKKTPKTEKTSGKAPAETESEDEDAEEADLVEDPDTMPRIQELKDMAEGLEEQEAEWRQMLFDARDNILCWLNDEVTTREDIQTWLHTVKPIVDAYNQVETELTSKAEVEKRYEEIKSILAAPTPAPTDNNQTSLTE